MRPAVPDVFSPLRRNLLQAGAALLVSSCVGSTGQIKPAQGVLLERRFGIAGARLASRVDIAGGVSPDALGAYIAFVFPVAVAVSHHDIYIADAGLGRLFRYERGLDAMAVMPGVTVGLGTRLQAGPDGSIYLLDPRTSTIHRLARGGQTLSVYRARLATSRYVDFAVDPVMGRIFAVDSAYRLVDEIHPLGLVAIEMQRSVEPGPIATDGQSIFVAGDFCACVQEWIRGRAARRFGGGKLRHPLALAMDGKALYAIDGIDRSIGVLHEEGFDALLPSELGLMAPESLAIGHGLIYIADGIGQRITAFAHRRPAEH